MMLAQTLSPVVPDSAAAAIDARSHSAVIPPLSLRLGWVFVLLSITVLTRFGINFGSYSLDISFIALYVLLAGLLISGRATLDICSLLIYAGAIGLSITSLLININIGDVDRSSTTSLILLIALYLPFIFLLKQSADTPDLWLWLMRAFSNVALFCGIAGIFQFYAQFFIHQPWLFDFTSYIPEAIRGSSGYNTVISAGTLYKSNGFVFREPSAFSFIMALALLAEILLFRRVVRIAIFGLAMLLTYSGTGPLALLIGFMFPLGRRTLVQVLLLAGGGFVIVLLFGDVLNLSFTLNRVTEFSSENSSAYIRYIAPWHVVWESIDSDLWAPLLGHGPGTIQRTSQRIAFFDPTWAKLLFEYGVLGFLAFCGLVAYTMNRIGSPIQIRMMLFSYWLIMGGHLLSPENLTLIYALSCIWPAAAFGQTYQSNQRPSHG